MKRIARKGTSEQEECTLQKKVFPPEGREGTARGKS